MTEGTCAVCSMCGIRKLRSAFESGPRCKECCAASAKADEQLSAGELHALDYIMQTLMRGGTPGVAVRSKGFAPLCRKIKTLKAAAEKEGAG